ncbi:hypothetical protein CFP56_009872 [Quercus suber]|uniref:Uncharacterized protein n=1 Tax=Quercus suber TaxID=58331 RepID=A0AAW0L0W3_QUESU
MESGAAELGAMSVLHVFSYDIPFSYPSRTKYGLLYVLNNNRHPYGRTKVDDELYQTRLPAQIYVSSSLLRHTFSEHNGMLKFKEILDAEMQQKKKEYQKDCMMYNFQTLQKGMGKWRSNHELGSNHVEEGYTSQSGLCEHQPIENLQAA